MNYDNLPFQTVHDMAEANSRQLVNKYRELAQTTHEHALKGYYEFCANRVKDESEKMRTLTDKDAIIELLRQWRFELLQLDLKNHNRKGRP